MRETTYRYWDKKEKKMYYDVEKTYDWESMPLETGEDDEYVLMQYTGLKDRKGKKIYEKDVVLQNNIKQEVSYGIQGVDAFEGIGFNLWSFYGEEQGGTRLQSEIEVIGNIYQNPDLLK